MHSRSGRGATDPTIVYVSHASEWGGGGEMVLVQCLKSARQLGYSVCLVCPPGDLAVHAQPECDRVVLTPVPWPRRTTDPADLLTLLTASIRFWRTLTRLLITARPCVIHANSGAAALVCTIPALVTRVPLIWHQHDILPRRRINSLTFRVLGHLCAAVIATSGAVRESLLRLAVPSDRVLVIYPALRERFTAPPQQRGVARGTLGLRDDAFIVAVVGRLVRRKAQDMLLLALQTVRHRGIPAEAIIVGSPPSASAVDADIDAYQASLQALASSPGLRGHVHMYDFREDIETVLDAADCLAVPSYCEPFGMVIPEAFARDTPVVAMACGGPVEIIEPGKSGLLVPPGDSGALARALETLASDHTMSHDLAQYAHSVALRRFSGDALRARLAQLYAAYASSPAPRGSGSDELPAATGRRP